MEKGLLWLVILGSLLGIAFTQTGGTCGVSTSGMLIWVDSTDYPGKGRYWPTKVPGGWKKRAYIRRTRYDTSTAGGDSFRITSDYTYINLPVNLNKYPQMSMDLWVKLASIPSNSQGWAMSNDNGGYDRSLILHDYRFGGVAIGAGQAYKSSLPRPAIGQWVHVVGVWRRGGASSAYLNGVKGNVVTDKSGTGYSYTQLGSNPGHKYPRSGRHYINGWIASARIWGRALSDSEVSALYAKGAHCTPAFTPYMKTISGVVTSETDRRRWWNTDPGLCNPTAAEFYNKYPAPLGKMGGATVTVKGTDAQTVASYVNYRYPWMVYNTTTISSLLPSQKGRYLWRCSCYNGMLRGETDRPIVGFNTFKVKVINRCGGNGVYINGKCQCEPNFGGPTCTQCATGRWGYPKCDYVKWNTKNVCYNAYGPKGDSAAGIFTAMEDYQFADVVLMHKSGYTCNALGRRVPKGYRRGYFPWECRYCRGNNCRLPRTPWYKAKDGCSVASSYRVNIGVVLTDSNNKVIVPEASTKTNPFQANYRPDFRITYKTRASFTKGQKYKVWYGEVWRKYTLSDNWGIHCVDVYVRPAVCEKEPPNPTNGVYRECEGTAAGKTCPLTCQSGYAKSGNAVCTGNPTQPWQTPYPTCKPLGCDTAPPYAPSNGQFVGSCANQQSCTLQCNSGYVAKGNALCIRGKWTTVTCHKDASTDCIGAPSSAPANGRYVSCQNVATGNTCKVICNGGFKKVPGGDAVCRNGQYQTVSTPCIPISCMGNPPVLPHMVNYTTYCNSTAGTICTPNCGPGYYAVRGTKCVNGRWYPGHCGHKCSKVKCGKATQACEASRCNPLTGKCESVPAGTGGKCNGWGQCFNGYCVAGSAYCKCQQKYAVKPLTPYGPRCAGPQMSTLIGSFIMTGMDPNHEFGPGKWRSLNGKIYSANNQWVCTVTPDPNLK